MKKNIFLIIFLVILLVLLFIAFSKSIHAQDSTEITIDRWLIKKGDSVMCIVQWYGGDKYDTLCWQINRKIEEKINFPQPPPAEQYSNKYYAPTKEIVCERKIMHGRNIVITKAFTVFNKKQLSNFTLNYYVVTDDVYYFVRKHDEFNAQGLRHFFKKSKIWKIIKRL